MSLFPRVRTRVRTWVRTWVRTRDRTSARTWVRTSVRRWLRRIPATVVLLAVVVRDLVAANLKVATEIVPPGFQMHPGIVRVPTRTRTPMEATILANLITMTPGTLTLEVDPETYDLYVHSLYLDDVEEFRAHIARTEDRLLEVMR